MRRTMLKNVNKLLNKAGFTLVELMVVMAIMGILVAVVLAGVSLVQKSTRDDTRTKDLGYLKQELESCYTSIKAFPNSLTNPAGTPSDPQVIAVCNPNNTIKMQQLGLTGIVALGSSSSVTTGDTCTGVPQASSSDWKIGYGVIQNSAGKNIGYHLCTNKENGTIINFSSDK